MGLLVVVVIAAASAPPPGEVQGVVSAAEEALGPGAIVVVRELPSAPTDDDARALETTLHADAIVVLSCDDAACDAARLHMATTNEEPFRDRTIKFAAADAPNERGRTLGFALASMIPPKAPEDATVPPAAPTPTPTPAMSSTSAKPKDTIPEAPTQLPRRARIDALAMVASGVGGTFGVEAGVRIDVTPSFAIGAVFDARFSAIDAVSARSTMMLFGPFVAWSPFRRGIVDVAVRLDGLAMRQVVERRDTGETGGRWVPAARLGIEGALAITTNVGVVAFAGPEVAFGTTTVRVGDATATTLPRFRVVGGLGIRGVF